VLSLERSLGPPLCCKTHFWGGRTVNIVYAVAQAVLFCTTGSRVLTVCSALPGLLANASASHNLSPLLALILPGLARRCELMYHVSCIMYRVSRIAYRLSPIAYRVSRIAHRASRIAHRASRIAHL